PDLRLHILRERSGALIGTLFNRGDATPVCQTSDASFLAGTDDDLAGSFCRFWGTYVAIERDQRSGGTTVVRDPGGGLEAYVVDCGGAALITNALPPWLVHLIDRPIPIDKALLANALAMPIMAA